MKLIYVAGKYTGTAIEIERNITAAKEAAIELMSRGWAVITPHLNTANFEKFEKEYPTINYNFYMQMDFEILKRCDAIFLLQDWEESSGAREEFVFASKNNIEVYEWEDGYPNP